SIAQVCFGGNCIDKLSFVHNISFMIGHLAPGHSIQKKTLRQRLNQPVWLECWGFHQDLRN
ncbi:hypothetical protein, partial [Vibrio cholerae]|uniref:hypothetical protein n=1 Tax=Vibrio cholerae TaxID=666 RepID=UPI001C10C713